MDCGCRLVRFPLHYLAFRPFFQPTAKLACRSLKPWLGDAGLLSLITGEGNANMMSLHVRSSRAFTFIRHGLPTPDA